MICRLTSALSALFILICLGVSVEAANVKSVKGKRVVISVGEDTLTVGQIVEVVGADGKMKGLIKIQQIKGKSALGLLGKGAAATGDDLRPRSAATKSKVAKRSSSKSSKKSSKAAASQSYIGIIAGMSMNSATVDLRDTSGNSVGTVDLTGSGFSAKGLYDYPVLPFLNFRALGGIEQFNVGGVNNTQCSGGECNAEIMYLTLDFWGRFPLSTGAFAMWVGAGFDILFPITKSATALDESSITNTSVLAFGGGVDWALDANSFVPLQVEYGLYPSSDQVKANAIMFRAGYAWKY